MNPRIGFGYDIHKFAPNIPLILGGVRLPFPHGLEGHSDADVLIHAICDGLLGAAALGDIGNHFPNDDAKYKNISSLLLLKKVTRLLQEKQLKVINVDSTVVLESPKIAPHVRDMRMNIAEALSVEKSVVSVKATTHEGIGPIGKVEACAAYAVVLIAQ